MSIKIIPHNKRDVQLYTDWTSKEADAYRRERESLKSKSEQFQISKLANLMVINDRKIVFKTTSRIRKKKLLKLIKQYPSSEVWIEYGDGLIKRIPIKTFKKLIKIKHLTISRDYELCTPDETDDYHVDWVVPNYRQVAHIFSIHHLMKELAAEESYTDMLEYIISSRMFILSGVDRKVHISYNSGSSETMTYNAFMKKYKLSFDTIKSIHPQYKWMSGRMLSV